MQSLLLDKENWDLVLDANYNLSICVQPYAVLQDVASALRVWSGECLYDIALGLPYDTDIFTGNAPLSLYQNLAEREAEHVPGVGNARVILGRPDPQDRALTGEVMVTMTDGSIDYVGF